MADDGLAIWTVYDHPRDFPNTFVARKHIARASGTEATDDIVVSPDLTALREVLALKGLTCITRHPDDEPQIVESWL